MDNYTEKEMRLLRSLIERKGMQSIIDTATEVFGNPLLVSDLGYKVLCRSNDCTVNDGFWKYLDDHSFSLPEQIAQIMRSGDFAKIYATDEPLIGKYDFAEHPFLAARIRDGSHVMGHICVYGSNHTFREFDRDLLILLCKVIAYEMLYRGISKRYEIPYYALLTDLLEGTPFDEREVKMQLQSLNLTVPKRMILMIVDFRNTAVQATIHYIREYLTQHMPKTLGIVYKELLVLLAPEAILENHLLENYLSGYESNLDYRVGVSNVIKEIANLKVYYEQAESAIQISNMLHLEERLCQYSRLKVYQLLLYAQKVSDLRILCDPVVLEIQDYDQQYNTDYLSDLDVYLSCGKNINQAAQRACVHKNSMYYRISKMEELFSLSLKDEYTCFTLQLSLKILRLLNN